MYIFSFLARKLGTDKPELSPTSTFSDRIRSDRETVQTKMSGMMGSIENWPIKFLNVPFWFISLMSPASSPINRSVADRCQCHEVKFRGISSRLLIRSWTMVVVPNKNVSSFTSWYFLFIVSPFIGLLRFTPHCVE